MSITERHLADFRRDGVTIIEDILTQEEVEQARGEFHRQLSQIGINHEKILSGEEPIPDSGARIKSPISRLFYSRWKLLDIHLKPSVYQAYKTLIDETFANGDTPGFEHPLGRSDDIYAFIDRVCWRLPDHLRAEGGLALHLDRNPSDPYLFESPLGHLTKWRPIQGFITLTDHYGGESGGLKVVKGFHHRIDEYFKEMQASGEGGEFFRMGNHQLLAKECQPLDVPAGSLVMWDNRLPHATCQKLTGCDTREVVYVSYLPDIPLNQKYIQDQLISIKANRPPPYCLEDPKERSDRDWADSELSTEQRQWLGYNLKKK